MGKIFRKIVQAILAPFVLAADATMRKSDFALKRALHLKAIDESAEVVRAEMPDAMFCEGRFANLDYALSQRTPGSGMLLEFGVFKGATIRRIAGTCPDEKVFGFDSFRGLPERWVGSRNASTTMDVGGNLPSVPSNVTLIAGWFDATLPKFLAEHPGPVGFLHIDCDIYSSTRTVFEALKDRLAPGCVIVFDEFFGYHGFKRHEYRAFHEFLAASGRKFRFVSYTGAQATAVLDS
jgi:hypothetical protein